MPSALQLPASLRAQLAAGRVVPFLGAGLGRNFGLPDWHGLLRELVAWSAANGVPLGSPDLVLNAIAEGHLDAAAHTLGDELGARLFDALREILTPAGLGPTSLHRAIADVAWPAVLTTNFDNLLPDAIAPHSEVLTWMDDATIGDVLRAGTPHLMLVHGWIKRPETVVLTPQEYRECFRSPAQQHYLSTLLAQYSFLFLGCSLTDVDVKFFLEELRHAFGPAKMPHFAVMPADQVTELDTKHLRDNYGIEVIDYIPSDGHPQVEELVRQAIDALPQHLLRDPLIKTEGLNAIRALRTSMEPCDYLERFQETCQRLAASGFVRTAWTALQAELAHTKASIAAHQRVRATIAIADLMRADQLFDRAFATLRDERELLHDPSVDQQLQRTFEAALFTACLDEYVLSEASDAATRAAQAGLSSSELGKMRATLTVADFLHTGPTSAIPAPTLESDNATIAVAAEALAMRGGIENALTLLSAAADAQLSRRNEKEAAWLRTKRAEILFLAGRYEQAWDEFEHHISPLQHAIDLSQCTKLRRNQDFVGLLLRKPRTHRPLDDLVANATQDTTHLRQLLSAEQASREQKHYESLPPLWRDLRRAYCDMDWSARKRAHERLAWEALAAGWITQCIHHAILGENEECIKHLTEYLSKWRKTELVVAALSYALQNCHLARHVRPACLLVARIADIIPDDLIQPTVDWLSRLVLQAQNIAPAEEFAAAAWETITRIAFRLSKSQALALLTTATVDRRLSARCRERSALLRTITVLLNRIDNMDWTALAQRILPVVTTERSDADYNQALHLLLAIANRDTQARDAIAETLLPVGVPNTDFRLAAHASTLGRNIEPSRLKRAVEAIARRLPLQVWRGTGPPPAFELSFMITQHSEGEENIQIAIAGGGVELDFVSAQRMHIPEEALAQLLGVVFALVTNPLNIRANRIMLIDFISDIHDRLTPELATAAVACITPFATGEAAASAVDLPPPKTTDRMQWHMPSAEEQQDAALQALVTIAARFAHCRTAQLHELVEAGMLHTHPVIRAGACTAAVDLIERQAEVELLLITAMLDGELSVARAALQAIVGLLDRGDLGEHVPLLITVAMRCSTSPSPQLRALSARLVSQLCTRPISEDQRTALAQLQDRTKTDTHYGVRTATAAQAA